jgi:hypothetical protein
MNQYLRALSRSRGIHAVLDEALPTVLAHPQVVAVYAENVRGPHWEARYEVANGSSTYVWKAVEAMVAGVYGGTATTYPGAVRLEREVVVGWQRTKTMLREALRASGAEVAALTRVGLWVGSWNIFEGQALSMFREQLRDPLPVPFEHAIDGSSRCDACGKGLSDIMAARWIIAGLVYTSCGEHAARTDRDEASFLDAAKRLREPIIQAFEGFDVPVSKVDGSMMGPPMPRALVPVDGVRRAKVDKLLEEMKRPSLALRGALERKP